MFFRCSIPTESNLYFALLCQCWQDSARIWQKMTNYRKTRLNQIDNEVLTRIQDKRVYQMFLQMVYGPNKRQQSNKNHRIKV